MATNTPRPRAPHPASRRPGLPARAAIGALWLYRRSLSPALYFLGARCRHAPSCSEYGIEAFRRHGAWAGGWLTVSRLARCHPFGSKGWDPVPQARPAAGWRFWRLGDWAWVERGGEQEKGAQSTFSKDSENAPGAPSSTNSTSARIDASPVRE